MLTFPDSDSGRCGFCQPLFSYLFSRGNVPRPWPLGDVSPDFPRLEASAVGGCGACGFLRSVICDEFTLRPIELDAAASPDVLAAWDGAVTFESSLSGWLTDGLRCFRLRVCYGWSERVIDFSLYDRTLKSSPSMAEVDTVPLCPRSMAVIKDWLKDCDGHSLCQVSSLEPFTPTRLLDVGTDGGETLRLRVRTADASATPDYAALSYCWGKQPPGHPQHPLLSRTTRANVDARLLSLSENDLPLTIREAVIVARRLGIRFLWVDLLCIVQDDAADWARESRLMGRIFQRASLTIAATASISMAHGFLRRPRAHEVALPRRCLLRYPAVLPPTRFTAAEDRWSRRGWIFQEQRLSRRILHFGERCLYFECARARRSELREPSLTKSGPLAAPRAYEARRDVDEEVLGKKRPNGPPSFERWYDDVEKFSKTVLTFPADKLPAISGLAAVYAEALRSDYLAGLWAGNIGIGLLWSGVGPLRRPTASRAPSWSWAAADGAVRWDCFVGGRPPEVLVNLLSHDVGADPTDPQGRRVIGSVELSAVLVPFAEAEQEKDWDLSSGSRLQSLGVEYASDFGTDFAESERLWILPVLMCVSGARGREVRGLVLETIGGTMPTRFRRFGWYRSVHQGPWVKSMLASSQTMTVHIE